MAQQVTVEDVEQGGGLAPTGVFPPSSGGTVSVSEDGGEPKAVGEIPRKAAQPLRTEVSLAPDPVLGVTVQTKSTGDVAQQAAESIAAQTTPSFDTMLKNATGAEKMRLMSTQELAEAGDAQAKMRMMSMTESQVAPDESNRLTSTTCFGKPFLTHESVRFLLIIAWVLQWKSQENVQQKWAVAWSALFL